MDMSATFQAASEAKMPQAEIVHDRFHVAKNLNEAVDKVRHTEHRKLQDEGEETLTGSKFLFLFAPENLDVERRARLRDLLNRDLKVGRAWMLKEQFRHFWERANARTALSFFVEWYARAVRSRLKPMIVAAKMLKRHLLNLLNYHHYMLTNATAEGLNSRIGLSLLPQLPNPNPIFPQQTRSQPSLKSHGKSGGTPEIFMQSLLGYGGESDVQKGHHPPIGRRGAAHWVHIEDLAAVASNNDPRAMPLAEFIEETITMVLVEAPSRSVTIPAPNEGAF